MAPFKNYKFGQSGVDVDSSPIHTGVEFLVKAQNAIRDPLGIIGGLKNRPGLTKFNSGALAGSVLGGIAVPAVSPIDTRTMYLAQQTGGGAEQWFRSADLYVTPVQETLLAAWQDPAAYFSPAAQVARMGVFFNGQLYYAGADYTSGTTSPTIRVFNGSDDRLLTLVLPATTLGITGFFTAKGFLYILTLDSGTTDADFVGRVHRVNEQGHVTQIGDALATGYVPISLAVHNDLIYVGTARLTTTNEARIYRINPLDETTWTNDNTLDADDYMVTALASFKGLLYATTKNGGAGTKGKIRQRSNAGVWSTVDSTVNNTGTYDGLVVFGGALYASSKSYDAGANTAVIRKSTDGSSWSTVYNSASTTGVGLLTVVGLRIFSMGGTGILHSLDGSSYTAATPGGGGNIDGVIGTMQRTGAAEWRAPVSDTSTPTVNVTNLTTTTADLSSTTPIDRQWFRQQFRFAGTITIGESATDLGSASFVNDTFGNWYRLNGNLTSGAGRGHSTTWCTWETAPVHQVAIRTHTPDLTSIRYFIGLTSRGGSGFALNDTQTGTISIAVRYSTVAGDAGWVAGYSNASGTDFTPTASIMAYAANTRYKIRIEWVSDTSAKATITNLDTNAEAEATFSVASVTGTALSPWVEFCIGTTNRNIDILYQYGEHD